jgi:hypothetical protein
MCGMTGQLLAPDPPDQAVQYIDVRDLAAWLLTVAGGRPVSGR